ncbi:MAG: outer membrane beta-barrel protein [Candidatus Scalindua sp.]|nr:outer membrane beta-barrel protein [Candidatus Scalindua sp.]
MSGTNLRINTYLIGSICFIISVLCSAREIPAVEFDDISTRERILDVLERIPQSAGHINLGPIEINPSFSITGGYDDNVFNSASRRIMPHQDFYVAYEPKISLALPVRNHSLAFDYGFEILDYQDSYEFHATEQDHVNRRWGGSANFNFANGFSIRLSDRVSRITTPGRFTRRANPTIIDPVGVITGGEEEEEGEILETFEFNTFTPRRTFTTNVAAIVIDLPDFFDKIDFSIKYVNRDASYKEFTQRGQDRNTNVLSARVDINPLPKINITTGFSYDHRRYDNREGADSSLKKIPFNIIWRFTEKSHFFLNSDYNWRNYGSGIFADFHGYKAELGYRFNVTRRDTLTIKFERSLVEQQFQRENVIDFSKTPTEIINSGIGRNNPQYWTQLGIDYAHQFPGNFSVIFSPAWQRRRFRDRQPIFGEDGTLINTHQEIDTVRMEVRGRYTAPRGWLFGEISYNYQNRDSNLPNGDLVKNVGEVSVGLSF